MLNGCWPSPERQNKRKKKTNEKVLQSKLVNEIIYDQLVRTNEKVLQSKLVNEIIYDQLVRTDFHYIPSPRRRCQASF